MPSLHPTDNSSKPSAPPAHEASWLKHGSLLLATLFALTYGASRGIYATFYSRLGLAPEDVGLNEVSIVAHSGIVFGLLLVLLLSLAAVGFAEFRLVRR